MKGKDKKQTGADLLKAQLSKVVTSNQRAGGDVAKDALGESEGEPKKEDQEASQKKAPKKDSPPKKKTAPPKAKEPSRLEKVTISLHEDDLAILDDLDLAFRKAKVPMRGVGISTLVKVAIKGFQVDSKELPELLKQVQAQDGRRRKP